ncbi:MFS transporter [Streptomyces sp. LX-29]|uniref:MFS transporter n=1 Tax=Streptomyces sp. LX-29 TaxID=2900152 RepID=UPI00240CF246|nr:MFS transporter [Streptomyces sp. LX-29]WFB08927.1 MFS transporter [Streptomyces sp. LX-29]
MPTITGAAATRTPSPSALAESVRRVPILWLALLATPVAAANNATVLILGDMSRSLGISTAGASWLVTVFALALAVATPLIATLVRRRGTRTALWLSAAFVAVGTAVVATSSWLPLTLVGRAGQAAGGAGMMAIAMNLAGTARRMGVISAGFGILGAVGPLLGERLTDALSWRAALSVVLVTLLAVPAVSRHTTRVPTTEGRFDTRGAVLLAVLSSSLVLLPSNPLPALAAAAVTGSLLSLHIRRRPDGYVPAVALRSRLFRSSVLIALALSASYFTLLFAIPQLIADRADWSTGSVATGQMVAMIIGSALTLGFAAVAARLGHTRVRAILIAVGVLAATAAIFAHSAIILFVAIGLAVFSATGVNATQSMTAASAVPDSQRPTGIGLFQLAYLMGGALGPALATLLVLG